MFLPATITLKQGDSGDYVMELQRRLAAVQCFSEAQANGIYDAVTFSAVLMFQTREGIRADGIAGPRTIRRLNCVISGEPDTSDPEEDTPLVPDMPPAENHSLLREALAEGLPPESPASFSPIEDPAALTPPPIYPPQPIAQPAPQPELLRPIPDAPALPPSPQPQALPLPPAPPQHAPHLHQDAPALLQPASLRAASLSEASPIVPPVAVASPLQEAPPERKSMVSRAMEYASASLQKLASYFEAKLPPDVHAEVKAIGAIMAKSGMKESAIPTDLAQERAERQELGTARGNAQQRA